METFDQTDAACVIYVYRQGLARAVGHDLAIEVHRFDITVDQQGGRVDGRFRADSLAVRYAMEGGQPQAGRLSDKDIRKIERTMRQEVLQVRRYPVIRFESTAAATVRADGAIRIDGRLELHGVARDMVVDGRVDDGQTVARATVDQTDFDIEPYRAFLGALQIKPHVDIVVRAPVEPDGP